MGGGVFPSLLVTGMDGWMMMKRFGPGYQRRRSVGMIRHLLIPRYVFLGMVNRAISGSLFPEKDRPCRWEKRGCFEHLVNTTTPIFRCKYLLKPILGWCVYICFSQRGCVHGCCDSSFDLDENLACGIIVERLLSIRTSTLQPPSSVYILVLKSNLVPSLLSSPSPSVSIVLRLLA